MNKTTTVFTPKNLVLLGYFEDFRKAYDEIYLLYQKLEEEYTSKTFSGERHDPFMWNRMVTRQVRKICEPLLIKYSFLFYPESCIIHANAYGFSTFTFLNLTTLDLDCHCKYSFISFEEFLVQLKYAVVRVISRWKNREKPHIHFEDSEKAIEIRIQLLLDTETQSYPYSPGQEISTSEPINHYILFKQWLINAGKLESCPDAVSFAFGINKFLQRRICNESLWEIIRKKKYTLIYKCRQHPQYQRSKYYAGTRETVLRLCFEYLNQNYDEYIQYEAERSLSELTNPHTIYLHQGNIACLKYHHHTNDFTATIAVDSEIPLHCHVTRCWRCNIAFMHRNYYLQLRKQHPYLVANFGEIDANGYSPIISTNLAAESPLKLCGYSARKDSPLSDAERQCILASIIDNGILTKAQILQYLSHFIMFNGSKMNNINAVSKWESDYDYVANLNIEEHPTVYIDEIRPYSQKPK